MIQSSTRRRARATTLTAVVIAAALTLSGCGRSDEPTSDSAEVIVDDKPATGVVTLWAPDGDATAIEDVLATFEADNPDLDLQVTLVPSDNYMTKLKTAIASGTQPDIAQIYTESSLDVTSTGSFAPVPDGLVDESSFFPAAWEAGKYGDDYYAVPWYTYTRVLIYRSDIAETGGAVVPTTWDQTIPFLEALEAGGAETALGGDVGWDTYNGQTLSIYANQTGEGLLNDDGTAWDIDNDAVIEAIEYQSEPFLDGLSSVDGPLFLDSQPYFVEGKTAAMISGPWVIASLDDTAQEEGWTAAHVGTAVLPVGPDNGSSQLGGGSWVVSKDSGNAASAWKVVRELAQEDTQVAQFGAYGSMPSVEAAWKDASITSNPLYGAFFDQLQHIETTPQVPTWSEVSTAIGKELEAVARGTKTAAEAAKSMQAQADSIGVGD